ncbi:TIGR02147 family protein [uncultured Fibrobacter sp.]|uniref:TIGR02147 family protein n=1 Tax=uncultured Fibrobacter sp. TaxID=261512 RepID=UPI00280474B7|nr:TIGR02147 family protein [uncultured Fibrobacter sp.]
MNVFAYYNYRKFLQDYYEYRKSVQRYFSYRAFAKRAGYSSSGFYLDLVKGRKSLTPQMVPRFIHALGLSEKEGHYFSLMVDFTHAETPESKQAIFDQMSALLPRTPKALSRQQVDYYKDWYNVAVREALSVLNISDNYQDLAFFMNPRITVPQAKRAIKLLSDLGLIEKENGFWRSVNKTITSGREIPAFIVHKFQKEMMDLGKAAVDNYSTERRNVSCTTMSVSPQGLERIIHKIDAFRKEVVDIVRSDDSESMIYELNIQFFPLSKELEIPADRSDAVRAQGGIDEN